jgi:hypothetical protein
VNFVAVPGILSTNVQSAIIELQGQINGVGLGVATETNSGSVRLATQVEVNSGTDNTTAVTPLKLGQYISNLGLSKSFLLQNVDIIGGTPYVVSFPNPASNLHAYYVSIKDSIGNTISLDVDSVDINSFTVSAISDLTNLTIFVTYI